MCETTYYQRNRDVVLNRAKDYYKNDKERLRDNFFFYLGFLLRTFTNHRTAGEGGRHFFNSSLAIPPTSQTLRR